jgi:glutamate-ammonia-ligase adenylyltransferase
LGGEDLTVIALGKFGGRELSYGADLDVVFVGDNVRAAQNLISAMTQPSAEGLIGSVDARLRPDGEKGLLVAPLAAYESYYRDRAQLWEIHALTRARPIVGPLQNDYVEVAQQIWREAGKQSDLFGKIDNMLERIQKERGSGSEFLDFKTGAGGMIEAEFLVQALQMHTGIWEPNGEKALTALRQAKVVSESDATKASTSYNFLRRIELTLRRFENKNVSTLPSTPDEQARLAKRLGHKDGEHFVTEYQTAREKIHALYQQHIKARL